MLEALFARASVSPAFHLQPAPRLPFLTPLQEKLVGMQQNYDLSWLAANVMDSASMDDDTNIDLKPILMPLVGEVGTGTMTCLELQCKLQEALNTTVDA